MGHQNTKLNGVLALFLDLIKSLGSFWRAVFTWAGRLARARAAAYSAADLEAQWLRSDSFKAANSGHCFPTLESSRSLFDSGALGHETLLAEFLL